MAKLPEVKIVSNDGEVKVSITLDLNINLNGADGVGAVIKKQVPEEEMQWAIPDFESGNLKFGNDVKE
jgi:hypothetical protein